ncbi:MAG: PD-(D/E)XK nuclease family protein, partial [Tepidiformaceae bacterium]
LLPPSGHEDPLLPDTDRETAQIPGRESRTANARADYLAALSSSHESTLCFSQSSLRSQAKQIPSRWLLESATALAGTDLSSEALGSIGGRPWLTAVASFEDALASRTLVAASNQEWELRSLLRAGGSRRHFLRTVPSFAASFQAASVRLPRWSRRERLDFSSLSPWAGGIGPGVALDADRSYSPTSFQTLATCGFQYFLKQVGRVKETQRPEEIARISGAERGNVIHAALERFLLATAAEGCNPRPGEAWSTADRERLRTIAGEECDKAYQRGITGSDLLWRLDRARICRDLALFLDADAALRAETGATFLQAERAFGSGAGDEPGDDVPWPAVAIPLGDGNDLTFRGRIDRVDVVQGVERPKLFIYDYKSGALGDDFKAIEAGGDRLAAGKQLQLPIYAMAVRQALGDRSTAVVANYWFVSEREQFRTIGYELTASDEENLTVTLGALATAVEAGTVPPVPGKKSYDIRRQRSVFAHCKYCAFDRVCAGGDRAEAWAERAGAAELKSYVALAAPLTVEGNGTINDDD